MFRLCVSKCFILIFSMENKRIYYTLYKVPFYHYVLLLSTSVLSEWEWENRLTFAVDLLKVLRYINKSLIQIIQVVVKSNGISLIAGTKSNRANTARTSLAGRVVGAACAIITLSRFQISTENLTLHFSWTLSKSNTVLNWLIRTPRKRVARTD